MKKIINIIKQGKGLSFIIGVTIFIGICNLILSGCTDNQRAKGWGGTETIELLPNHKFLNATWKGNEIWVTSIDTLTGFGYFKEYSKYGIVEGKVVITPTK